MANDSIRGRQVVLRLTNKSGGGLVEGDVVIISSGTAAAVTTTTSAGLTTDLIGVALETIANDAIGRICISGYVPKINLSASASLGDTFATHSVAKQAAPAASRAAGHFGEVLGTGTTPAALLWGFPDAGAAAGNMATDALWDAAGDLAVGTGADTAGRLAAGAAGAVLAMGNSAVIWNAGTSFPASKATNDRYWRTDLGLEFFWNGTRWLSTTLYICDMSAYYGGTAQPYSGTAISHRSVPIGDLYDMWIVDFRVSIRVNTTNDGTKYWTVILQNNPAATTLATLNTSAIAADTISRIKATAGILAATTSVMLQVQASKTSTPGTLDVLTAQFTYRLVGT